MLSQFFSVAQLVLAGLLVAAVLLQQKGSGLGATFGGSSTIYTTKKGVDKFLFIATIVISILFFLVALANIFII